MNREELYGLVEENIDAIFAKYQEANGITCGDIAPGELLKLKILQNQLTDLIVSVSKHNK